MKYAQIKKVLEYKVRPHIHFIGVGGKGLNGLAKYCLAKGWKVSGSDQALSREVVGIRARGGVVFHTHAGSNIRPGIDAVVYSSIVQETNPEMIAAREQDVCLLKRSEFLGLLMRAYNVCISVAGSHGKSTTTALCGLALLYGDADPSIFGGAYIKEIGAYERRGGGRFAVAEACEYDRSFFNLVSDITIITAIEKSHMEYYADEAEMVDAFGEFVAKHPRDAVLLVNGDDANIQRVMQRARATVETFGFGEENNYRILNLRLEEAGSTFDLYYHDVCIAKDIHVVVPGTYNVLNIAAAAALLHVLDMPLAPAYRIGAAFTGVGRRFEVKRVKDRIFIDDFCHHPTQVRNLFAGIKQFFPNQKVCAVFQPRQYHLMRTFIKEYGGAFEGADTVMVTDILPALGDTEADTQSLKSADIIDSIKKYSRKNEVFYMPNFNDIVYAINRTMNQDWVVATIGAGDVYKVRDMYVNTN